MARDALVDRDRTAVWGGVAVAFGTFILLVATGPSLAIVWDEGYTLGRQERVRLWFRAVWDPQAFAATARPPVAGAVLDATPTPRFRSLTTRGRLFAPEVLAWFWPFSREEPNGHPPFYAVLGLLGDVVAPWMDVLPRARLGPMFAFSVAAGTLFVFAARRWGPWAAALTAGAWVLQPRLFAHAHYALYDALLSALWVGCILAFANAVTLRDDGLRRPRWGWAVLFGALLGCAAATKFTGWFLPLPFLIWTALYRDRPGLLTVAVGAAVAVLTVYVLNPPWWSAPLSGVERFLHSNLTRGRSVVITGRFLGRMYATPRESLPWYNTLVWTVFVTPVGFLALAVAGLVSASRGWRVERFGVLAAANWVFLLALRALPHTPGHDAERLFLPAFGCLAVVAGVGTAGLLARGGTWGRALIVAAVVEGACSVAFFMPVPLSYYSPVVGGLPGAVSLGMEPTYYWDSLTADALDWINGHTGPGESVAFATNPASWVYLRRARLLRAGVADGASGPCAWYVLQNRPGDFSPTDQGLVAAGRWAFVRKKAGVPLLWVFPYAEFEACRRERARQTSARGPGKP